jgi:hypothetical protein
MPRVAKTKKRGKKTSEKEASDDGDGFETILSVGVGESTSLYMQRKSPTTARMKSKVAGSKKKTSKAATSTSEEPPSPESVGRKHPPEQLVVLDFQPQENSTRKRFIPQTTTTSLELLNKCNSQPQGVLSAILFACMAKVRLWV